MGTPQLYIPQTDFSQQAESSSLNPIASGVRMRMLIELQIISQLLKQGFEIDEDLRQMRQDIAVSMVGQS